MDRLRFGRDMDTLTLARNVRTSPQGIDRIWPAPLQDEIKVWFSTCDGVGERSGVNGNSTFNDQTTEQLGKAQMHLAHRRSRVMRKHPVCAKCPSRQSLCH